MYDLRVGGSNPVPNCLHVLSVLCQDTEPQLLSIGVYLPKVLAFGATVTMEVE